MDDVMDRSSLNKVIMVEGVTADKPGHLDKIDHPQCDVSPEQTRRKYMKASIQGAEEGYDVIQIVKIMLIELTRRKMTVSHGSKCL